MTQTEPMRLWDKLGWFVKNVDLQLDDLKQQGANVEIRFYWDTEHVMRAVLGMADFYDDGKFRKSDFDETKTLVISLAAANWFGPIHLLPPHRAEFYSSFKSDFGIGDAETPVGGAQRFFRDCELTNMSFLEEFRRKSADERTGAVKQFVGKADQLFKAVNYASGNWKSRLVWMYKSGLLKLEATDEIDYSELFEDPTFIQARDFFDRRRPPQTSGMNNFTDATAVCLLLRQITAFNNLRERVLPRFFETSGLFRQALSHVAEKSTENPTDILRDADYYLFRAMFKPPKELVQDGRHDKFISSLIAARDKVKNNLGESDRSTSITTELLDEIDVEGIRLRDVIDDLQRYSFLERVWLPYAHSAVSEIADQYVRRIVEATNEVTSDEVFDTTVMSTLDRLDRSLEGHVRQFRQISDLFQEFETHISRFQNDVGVVPVEIFDVFKARGLLRFGIPNSYHSQIKGIVKIFLRGEQERVKAMISKLCRMHREVEPRTDDVAIRATMLGVFWVLGMHERIKRLSKEEPGEPSWLLSLMAASAIEREEFFAAIRWIEEIEKQHNESEDRFARSVGAIRLAYLYFHLWRDGGGAIAWRHHTPRARAYPVERLNLWIHLSIQFAKEAYSALHRSATEEAYALNQYLYYVTEGGDDEMFRGITKIAGKLVQYKADPTVWQYRYDDTLARYFHRQSTRTSTFEDKRGLLYQAKTHIRDAVRDSYGDREVRAYESTIVNAEIDINEELRSRSISPLS